MLNKNVLAIDFGDRMDTIWMTMLVLQLVTLTSPEDLYRARTRGIKWWNLANTQNLLSDNYYGSETHGQMYINPSLQPLTRKQRRLVARNPGSIMAIARSARMAVEECQFQFYERRWNCPVSDGDHGRSVFGKILRKGCRETAFIYALTSSALAHSIARSCSEGTIYTCTCGHRLKRSAPSTEWEWGGCSDNGEFGHKFARDFIDKVEKGRDLRSIMNLHNNEAGRLHISRRLGQECKCHGMSGSCAVKTCWMRLPDFRDAGHELKERFDGASRVLQGNSRRVRLLPADPNHKPPVAQDLVYYESSPDFCDKDKSIGFKGTRGRTCNITSIGIDGCDLMCCGRGYHTETVIAKERCNCIFHWCCEVTCETCMRPKLRHTCL